MTDLTNKAEIKEATKKRYSALDIIRGISLVSMILYHGMWDVVYMFGVRADWYESYGAYLWQQSICWTFIFLSGFCFSFGRRKLRRALLVLGGSQIISLVTAFIDGAEIRFGVLCLIGSCMLFCIPLERLFVKIPAAVGFFVSFALFMFTRNAGQGYLGFGNFPLFSLPRGLYANYVTAYLGFPNANFSSADYFPLLPWFFLFVCGFFACRFFKKHNLLSRIPDVRFPPLEWLGRHSLIVYLLHQPLAYGILYIVFAII